MLSFPYLEELFTNILQKDTVMQGRFALAPMEGAEMNMPALGDIIQRAYGDTPKWPAVIMLPPTVIPGYLDDKRQRDRYNIRLLFLTQSFTAGNGMVKAPAEDGQSTHTIPQDWHDMKRSADEFMRVLERLVRDTNLKQYFGLSANPQPIQEPVSAAGNDKVSGIQQSFSCTLFTNACALEQYSDEGIAAITIPTTDSHPSHKH